MVVMIILFLMLLLCYVYLCVVVVVRVCLCGGDGVKRERGGVKEGRGKRKGRHLS